MQEDFVYTGIIRVTEANPSDEWHIDNAGYGNLGLNFVAPFYIETNEIQDKDYEYSKVLRALEKYKLHYAKTHDLEPNGLEFHFINYGRTELVYVLKNEKEICETVLIKQPGVRMGTVEREAQNLTELKKKDEHVVAPIKYFQIGDQELYTTPYMYQARCIAGDCGYWGMYIPEPVYRFEAFKDEIAEMVCVGMIAKLVSLYDHEKQVGIADCRLSSGDFMFPKDWDAKDITIESILENLYLIAARNMISCPFEEYLDIIREEFQRYTIGEPQGTAQVNVRSRAVMGSEIIERGINLGIELSTKMREPNNGKNHLIEQK